METCVIGRFFFFLIKPITLSFPFLEAIAILYLDKFSLVKLLEILLGGNFGEFIIATAEDLLFKALCFGNKLAICPSSPNPKIQRSKSGILSKIFLNLLVPFLSPNSAGTLIKFNFLRCLSMIKSFLRSLL